MKHCIVAWLIAIGVLLVGEQPVPGAEDAGYTRLVPAAARVMAAAAAFPGGGYSAENVLQPPAPGGFHAEYASHGLAAKTFIDFDLHVPVRLAAFRHLQRRTPDTIAEAELIMSDVADFSHELARVKIAHVDEPGATTFASFPAVAARYVRWQVTSVLPQRSPNVGGQSIEFFAAEGEPQAAPAEIKIATQTLPIVERQAQGARRPLWVVIDYPYAESRASLVRVGDQEPRPLELQFGQHTLEYSIPTADQDQTLEISIDVGGTKVAAQTATIKPVRTVTVYILPHSHTDIGYTAIQTDIEEKQINNLRQGLADARRTADYPAGARFVWNVEVLWAADLFRQRLGAEDWDEFLAAVKRGQVALNGMYLNELTGLCRPEELIRLFRYATQLSERTGTPLESAMISDVPGFTWGTVTAMNQAGIKYFSVAPNYFARIGDILVQWENKPFWWVGPDGDSRVLVWIPFRGYATSHIYGKLSPQFVREFCEGLQQRAYPYDIAYMRWAGHGDNAVPDPSICEFVRDWNATHESPQFRISSTSDAFRAFEQRYGDQLPQVRGDWTPYWEDGAGSSAAETAMNRASAERVAQAETLWAMLDPARYPASKFEQAWNNVLLYSEHTWGAHCSIARPASPFTIDQWNVKQSYATVANLQSRQLLSEAAQSGAGFDPLEAPTGTAAGGKSAFVDVYNTTAWPRAEIVLLPRELSEPGNCVLDDQGRPVPAQRLASDELAVWVHELPALAGRRYTIVAQGAAAVSGSVTASGATLASDKLRIRLNELTGGIIELQAAGIDANLVDVASGHAINDYLYLLGDEVKGLLRNGPVRISVRDQGPLVASLLVESAAPGCYRLTREIRMVAGGDYVELLNTVDKKRLDAANYYAPEGKESVNFAFPFQVPGGEMRLDVPWGVIRPESDQIPSACKNWLTVGRWGDVANADYGVTWVTLDAPLVQVGGITATLLNSQPNPSAWLAKIEPTQRLYSWAMNNHWDTNYRAYQEGPVVFRFVLRPHRGPCQDADASRFATAFSQPLVAVPGHGKTPDGTSLLNVEPAAVVVSGVKPSDDGKGIIVRMLNMTDQPLSANVTWPRSAPQRVWISDTSELPRSEVTGAVPVPARGVVALRAEWTP